MPSAIELTGLAKTLNLPGPGAANQSFNLFQIWGIPKIEALSCKVTTAFANNLTPAYFETWEGAASSPITLAAGGVVSSLPVGSVFFKGAKVGVALSTIDSSVGAGLVYEHATDPLALLRFFVVQRFNAGVGVATYIRFTYTAAGASTGVFVPRITYSREIDANCLIQAV